MQLKPQETGVRQVKLIKKGRNIRPALRFALCSMRYSEQIGLTLTLTL